MKNVFSLLIALACTLTSMASSASSSQNKLGIRTNISLSQWTKSCRDVAADIKEDLLRLESSQTFMSQLAKKHIRGFELTQQFEHCDWEAPITNGIVPIIFCAESEPTRCTFDQIGSTLERIFSDDKQIQYIILEEMGQAAANQQ
jgi:hypothetical protein